MKQKQRIPTQQLVLTALFAALTAIGAFLKITTPWSAFTLQVFFVFMAGVLLGPKYGLLSQVVYVGLGLIGLPIFTQGGGFQYIFVPSFGFLLSYIPAAWLVGMLTRKDASVLRVVLACIAGLAVVYAVGMPYMALILNVYMGKGMSVSALLWSGMIIFLPFDALKIVATAVLAKPLVPAIQHINAGSRTYSKG